MPDSLKYSFSTILEIKLQKLKATETACNKKVLDSCLGSLSGERVGRGYPQYYPKGARVLCPMGERQTLDRDNPYPEQHQRQD